MLGWIRIYFPNTSARKRAVQIHDLHHILTEYDTTLLGEAEIKAWELGSGGWQRHRIVLLFMLAAIPLGLWLDPRALWRAYRRGKNCRNLFDRECDDGILAETVGSVRARLGITAALHPAQRAL